MKKYTILDIHPKGHRVKVEIIMELSETDSASSYLLKKNSVIAIPDTLRGRVEGAKQSIKVGRVLEIGETAFEEFGGSPWCEVGDYVAFVNYAGRYHETESLNFRIINDEDIYGTLDVKVEEVPDA
jgi:co-chaperonin GroES (HSP10)